MLLTLLSKSEQLERFAKVRERMSAHGLDAILVSDNADKYYLTGRVFDGFVYLPRMDGPTFFVKRPVKMEGEGVVAVRKPEQMAGHIGPGVPAHLGLELDVTPYSMVTRLAGVFPGSRIGNASAVLREARSVKTAAEIEKIMESGVKQTRVYSLIPSLYRVGMTDFELQVEIERASRLEGCLGQFRISGGSMELYMANLLTGDNADAPSPYDFAMGGEGLDPSLPVGCNGSVIRTGCTVMADVNGNYTGYMTDMTRTFRVGPVSDLAVRAHDCSVAICRRLEQIGVPGAEAKALYAEAEEMAAEAGLSAYFMGHTQKAGFVGHGVGIEINELPVIAPRSRDVLQCGNIMALEPKFVIPHVGAVGIENTYAVTDGGLQKLTDAPEEMIDLI